MQATAINSLRFNALSRRLLSGVFLTLILVGGGLFSFAHLVHAQKNQPAPPAEPPATQETATPAVGSGEDSGNLSWEGMTIGAILSPVAIVAYAMFTFAKACLWVAGILLNFSIVYLVFEFGTYLGTSPGMLIGWSILRDLGNILLLFGFLTIGFRAILNVSHFSAGKTLANLIFYAALLNFSLFTAAAIVDLSNGFTLALFSQNVGYKCETDMESCLNDGITGQIAQQANILSAIGAGGQQDSFQTQMSSYLDKPLESILQFLVLGVLVMIAACAIFAAGFLLITRGITLAFLMVVSPIGFAGMVIPALQENAKRWWKSLIDNALFAPVFLILLFVSLRMTDGLAGMMGGNGGLAGALAGGGTGDAGALFYFFLVIGFLIATLKVGKSFSIMGADFAIKSATSVGFGGMARVGNFFGGGSARMMRSGIQSSKTLRNLSPLQAFTNRVLRPLEKTNLDVRRTALGAQLGSKPAEHALYSDTAHIFADAKAGKEGKKLKKEFMGEVAVKELEQRAHHGGMNSEDKKTLSGMSAKKISSLHAAQDADPKKLASQEFARALNPQQFDDVMKLDVADGGLDDIQKGALREARFKHVETAATPADAATEMKGMGKADFEAMPPKVFMRDAVLQALTSKQRDEIMGSGKFSKDQKDAVKANSPSAIFKRDLQAPGANRAQVINRLGTMKSEDMADLPIDILRDPGVVARLTTNVLSKIQAGNKLENQQDITALANEIRTYNPQLWAYIDDPNNPAYTYWH